MDYDALAKLLPPHVGMLFTDTIHHTLDPAIDPANAALPDGYTVLVIGAGGGIGEYIAKAFVKAKASNVIITGRSPENLARVKGELEEMASRRGSTVHVSTEPGDASREETYPKLKQLLQDRYGGRLDCTVCCAGNITSINEFAPLPDFPCENFLQTMHINLFGPFYAARHLLPLMLQPPSTGKLFINIVSIAAHLTGLSPISYNIAKLAQTRLSQQLGETYADQGLVVIAMHPGSTRTPGTKVLLPAAVYDGKALLSVRFGFAGSRCAGSVGR
ncbi:hypothetical protein BDY17DRAFT_294946 [Neohortaea acidophila]|uniref:NAD(P)-binding protein n=1 Tax=Neohortaea acidophila TaxID=245834 RepID=A0A6A6PX71_9PEZI|nr:uncharacterized protein BDY17DRAFT_294946 [Neohortaea acidophila]KAF2484083.1 hypothetical protein BDY17DRAFT_294946 [Neohortaea acidophila]